MNYYIVLQTRCNNQIEKNEIYATFDSMESANKALRNAYADMKTIHEIVDDLTEEFDNGEPDGCWFGYKDGEKYVECSVVSEEDLECYDCASI